jgi:hypothetical protein
MPIDVSLQSRGDIVIGHGEQIEEVAFDPP